MTEESAEPEIGEKLRQALAKQDEEIGKLKAAIFDCREQRDMLDNQIQQMRVQLSGLLHRRDTLASAVKEAGA